MSEGDLRPRRYSIQLPGELGSLSGWMSGPAWSAHVDGDGSLFVMAQDGDLIACFTRGSWLSVRRVEPTE